MRIRVQHWLTPPVFPDEEQTRLAGVVGLLLLALSVIMVSDAALLLVSAPETIPTFWLNGAAIVGSGILWWLTRNGHVRLAGALFCLTLWPLTVDYLAISGGLTSPTLSFLSLFIVVGVTLFGTRGAIVLGLLDLACLGGLYLAGTHALLVSAEGPPTLARLFTTNSMFYILLTAVVAITGRSISNALARAREGERTLAQRNRDLQIEVAERRQAEEALRASEERYRLLFNSINDAAFVSRLTEDGRPGTFVQVNDVACQRLGYTREELLALSPPAIGAPEKAASLPAVLEQLISDTQVLFETEHVAKDGRRLPTEISARVFQVQEQPMVLSIARDITERKKAEEALAKERNLLRSVIDILPDNIFVKDREGRFLLNNRVSMRLLGASRQEDLLGKTDFDVLPRELAEYSRTHEEYILRTGQPIIDQEEFQPSKTDEWRWLVFSTIPLRDEHGE
ncbi:MAG TPA: PAS domain S-box protein, partial [Aggregatilineales bacterium]|nr:PAS domain S-box protein [Aggregatilineales bacterium]